MVGTVGSLGSVVFVGVGVAGFLGGTDVLVCLEGVVVAGAFGLFEPVAVPVGVLPVRCEGRTRDAACSAARDFTAVVALFSLAITGTATVTTATAAAISAANHNFLNALSWERETRCSQRET